MAKKYYLVTYSWDLNQNLPLPIPSGFRWKSTKHFYMKLDQPPTYGLILKLAIMRGSSKEGFRVEAVSEVPDTFLTNWGDADVFNEDGPVNA